VLAVLVGLGLSGVVVQVGWFPMGGGGWLPPMVGLKEQDKYEHVSGPGL